MFYSDDPLADYDRYETEQEKWLNTLPVCVCCGDPIQDEYYYNFDGDNVCNEHLQDYCDEHYKKYRE